MPKTHNTGKMEKVVEKLQSKVIVVESALVSLEELVGKHDAQFIAIIEKLEAMDARLGKMTTPPDGSDSSSKMGSGSIEGGGNSGTNLTVNTPRIEFPSFDGTDPMAWLAQAEQYSLVHRVPLADRVQLALIAMTGRSMFWAQWVLWRSSTIQWGQFNRELLKRFGDSSAINAYEVMHITRRTGTLEEYLSLFEERVAQLLSLPPEQYLGMFLGGLQPSIRDRIPDSEMSDIFATIRAARRIA